MLIMGFDFFAGDFGVLGDLASAMVTIMKSLDSGESRRGVPSAAGCALRARARGASSRVFQHGYQYLTSKLVKSEMETNTELKCNDEVESVSAAETSDEGFKV